MALSGALRVCRRVPYLILAPPGRSPARGWPAVLALHGYGWDETRFCSVIRRRFARSAFAWIVPRGPWRVHPERGEVGYAWLVGSREHPDHEGMQATEVLLSALLRAASRRLPIDRRRIGILGFSQGGFAAGVAALRRPRAYRAAAVLGAYINPAMVPGGLPSAQGARLGFFHGRQDRDVPLARARQSLRQLAEAGIEAELRTFPGGHKLSEALAAAAAQFLEERLRLP